jgi:putative transposase
VGVPVPAVTELDAHQEATDAPLSLDNARPLGYRLAMPRTGRLVIPGCPHHVTHRGNSGELIFVTPQDRDLYRQWLREYATEHGLRFWAYCLMTNHVHLIAVPEHEESLALAIGQAHQRYSRWVGRKQQRSGHLWASRFFSAPMDEPHLWAATKYVELNPVRAGLATYAEDYRWSSAAAHVRGTPDALLSTDLPAGGPRIGREWREWLAEGLEDRMVQAIRYRTRRGLPLGSREFMARVMGRSR